MKICLKHAEKPEHIRLTHDNPNCGLRIWIGNGEVHVSAMAPEDGRDTRIVIESNARIEQ